jgi:RHS repeat-associated protein
MSVHDKRGRATETLAHDDHAPQRRDRPSSHTGAGPRIALSYGLDANGNRVSMTKNGATENYTLDNLNRLTAATYANGDVVTYADDANGNRLTKTFNGVPTAYSYDNADRMVLAGGVTYTYDPNGNMTARGVDSFAWDYASRMTGATVGGVAATYSYDGSDVRVGKSVSGTPTTYLWDRESGLPLLVDDGTNGYLQADGPVAQVAGAVRTDLLGDALGSVRGQADAMGTLIGTADYDVFGTVRASTGAAAGFGFTGEQLDAETGYEYLRARYYDPSVGRFPSADTVRPNAPGTQGYNPYAYVANNPARWVDPRGHGLVDQYIPIAGMGIIVGVGLQHLGYAISGTLLYLACYPTPAPLPTTGPRLAARPLRLPRREGAAFRLTPTGSSPAGSTTCSSSAAPRTHHPNVITPRPFSWFSSAAKPSLMLPSGYRRWISPETSSTPRW